MKKFLLLIFGFALLLVSCGKEPEPEPSVPRNTFGAKFVEAHDRDLSFIKVFELEGDTYVSFSESFTVKVPARGMTIVHGGQLSSWQDNVSHTWRVADNDTGVSITKGSPFSGSLPVYAWYSSTQFSILYSNGETMVFRVSESEKDPDEPDNPTPGPVEPQPYDGEKTIPVIYLTTDGGAAITSKTTYVKGNIQIKDTTCMYSSVSYYSGAMEIRGRGNSTWSKEKKPYKIKLESKAPLLGMPSDKEWALIANYSDKSMLRNAVAMRISRQLGFAWTPHFAWAEVYLNGEYLGLYNLFEHKEVNGHKVAIDVDGGDIYLEMDKSLDEPVSFKTEKMKLPVMFKDPQNPSDSVVTELKAYLKSFEKALMDDALRGDPKKGYEKYIDVPSFINYFIIQEMGKNIDGKLCKSTFLTRKPGGKLVMYHVWDFDLAWGNCNYFAQYYPKLDNGPTQFQTKDYTSNGENTGWYYYLFQDPVWVDMVQAKWNEMMPFFRTIPDFIDSEAKMIRPAVDRNFEKWKILGVKVWPNVVYPKTYEEEIAYLKEYYMSRLGWLDQEINKL